MTRFIFVAVCVLHVAVLVHATGLYSVIGPGTIRSNFKYNVAVSVHKADGPCKIKVSITGPSYNETKEIDVAPMSSEQVVFDVPKLQTGDYNLTAVGIAGLTFENSTKLNYADNKPSIFIQTDKATYKPADIVKFRVLFLNENTRPASVNQPITISVSDGAQNRIKQWRDVKLTKGVYTGELQLSEQPVLGNWKLEVAVEGDGSDESKTFEVAKYVLPKFEVTIDTAKDVAIQDGVVKATVRAKYTYGKPVKGKATVSLKPSYSYWGGGDAEFLQEKTIDVDGKGHVEFDLKSRDLSNRYLPQLSLLAVLEEELTGNKQNGTASVTLHSQRYRIENVNNPSTYHPGKPFTFNVVVKNLDGSPVREASNKVKVIFEAPRSFFIPRPVPLALPSSDDVIPTTVMPTPDSFEFEANLNENGIAEFNVTLPENDRRYYSIKAIFLDTTSYLSSITKFEPTIERVELLQIDVKDKKARLGNDVSIEFKSSEMLPYFVYTIVARGNIIKSERVDVPEGRKSHTIKITPTFEMIPKATIYAHNIFDNNLRFDEKSIDFEQDFENSIEISAPQQAKPSEEVKLKVKTDPDSFVGLLGVDQSVLLLKSGNDLDREQIFRSLNKYDTSTPWQRGYGRYPGQTSGLITFTNANYPYNNVQRFTLRRFPDLRRPSYIDDMNFLNPRRQMSVGYHYRSFLPMNMHSVKMFEVKNPAMKNPAMKIPAESIPTVIRKNFLENWINDVINNTDAEGFTLAKKIPDTITSWVVTGFSLNPKSGIALTQNPSKIRVFQPFFVSTNLPYSVKRGEVIAIPVIIFNYMDKSLDAEVVMDNSDKEYEFTEATNEVEEKAIDEVKRTKRVTIPSNSGKSVSFMIRPKNVGTTTLKITATTPLAGDAIHQKLKVEPEGVTIFENKAVFINLKDEGEVKEKLDVNVPAEAVPDSEYIEFSVVGDLLGPTIKNLDNLVRMPYGCGEQNMVNFVPNILVLKYLEATNKQMPTVQEKAKKFLEIGYQRELTYKHDDGSYSAFGKSDKSGSTWLTAYVVRSFHQAAKYTDVDPKIITQGLNFLAGTQKENGEFPEVGKLFDSANQNELSLTSFVLLAFFENEEQLPNYQSKIGKSVEYVAGEVDKTDDQYSLAIAAVALQQAKHPKAEKVLAKLEGLAKSENERKWWSKAKDQPSSTSTLYWRPRSNDVEITAYVLLAILEKGDAAETTLPIIKWLISQRNSNGGFSSTQDTVVGLQALIKFASKTGSGSGNIDIDFVSTGGAQSNGNIKVNPDNSLVLQTHVLPKTARQVEFTAKGKGSSMVQLSYRYNLAEKEKKPSFKVNTTIKDNTPPQQLIVEICAEYVPLEANDKKDSNMAVIEVALPSGYTSDAESFGKIQAVDRVKRIETKNSESTVIIYLDSLTPGDVKCMPVESLKSHAVAKQKPASVSIYDYYDTERRATEYYQVKSSLCDICEGDDCGNGCKAV